MASEIELRWLKTGELKGAAKRFAEFCKEDISGQAKSEDFSLDVYQDAIKLVLSKLDHSLTLDKFNKKTQSQQTEISGSVDLDNSGGLSDAD